MLPFGPMCEKMHPRAERTAGGCRAGLFLQTADLVLDQGTHGVSKLIQRADAGKVPAVDGVGGGNVGVITGKDTQHRNIPVQQGADLGGGVGDTGAFAVIRISLRPFQLADIVGLGVGQQDHHAVLAGGVLQLLAQTADGQAVPVAAGGEVAEDALVLVGFPIVPVAGEDRVAAESCLLYTSDAADD